MTRPPFTKYRLQIEPLSPVHIGSGRTIEPYEYELREQNGTTFLLAFDLDRLLVDLSDTARQEFNYIIERGDFPGVRAWLREQADERRHLRFAILVQPKAADELKRNLDNPERLGEIELFARHPDTGQPYIPGSSIKGAIRTALVNAAVNHANERQLKEIANDRRSRRSSAVFEAAALGHIDRGRGGNLRADLYRDPLRQIAVSDANLPTDGCYIDQMKIVRPSGRSQATSRTDPSGIVMYRDVTWSMIEQEPLSATAEFRLLEGLNNRRVMKDKALPTGWSIEGIARLCNEYYTPEIDRQLQQFQQPQGQDFRPQFKHIVDTLEPNQCIIRVGRHSHWECVTVSRKFAKPPRRGFGQSRTYVAGELPLGWVRLTFHPES